MRNDLSTGIGFSLLGAATLAGNAAYGQAIPSISGLDRSTFAHPNTGTPSGTTTFTPADTSNLFVAQMLARVNQDSQKQTLKVYAEQVSQMVEKAYADYGYAKNDTGAALGGLLETCWEVNNGSFKIGMGTAQDKAKTQATIRQVQNALLASPVYKAMPNNKKQLLYEASTFMMGDLVTQWQQAGSDSTRKTAVRQNARKQLQIIFGIDAASLTRKPDGAFVSTTTGRGENTAVATSASTKSATPPAGAAATGGPLPAASVHGAQVFVKYTFQATTTRFEQLILFPDGTAFTDIPSKPVPTFDEATLRAALKPYDVGTWKQSGNTIILTFPNKARGAVSTLRKVPRGWYDGTGKLDTNNSYDTYFPAIPLTPAQIVGAWKSESLTTMGFAGGGAPMVAAGRSGNRIFQANGTFTSDSKSFASATTANMGDAFKTGGDVGAYNAKDKTGAGRWRLDGPLITMESGGKRTVALAFVLPNWNKTGPPEILIDGDWWQRPDKK